MPKKIRKSLDTLLDQFEKIHGTTYDYSNVNYLGSNYKIEIICKIHGSFLQRPNDHIAGSGCSKCKGCHRVSQEDFIQRSNKIHKDRYILDNANYLGRKKKVQIGCKIHGNFFITPSDFWNGVGCQQCGFDQARLLKISKGIYNDPSTMDEFLLYKRKVRSISERNFKKFHRDINPCNIKRSYHWHLDHKFSIFEGFRNKVPPENIGHWQNLRLIERRVNQIKGSECDITLEELNRLIEVSII
jgi:hypothetical protein